MKKIFLPIFFCLLASQFIVAQTKEKSSNESPKFFAVFSVGAAAPVGTFAKKNPEVTTEAGLAKLGYNLAVNAGYQFTDRIGLASSLYHSRFKLDQKAIDDYLKNIGSGITTKPDHWQYFGLVVGPMVSFSLSKDVYLDFKAMGGVANANMPVFKFEVDGLPIPNATTKEHWAYSFAWQLGSNIRYNFAPGVCFYANYDYNFMKPTWSVENSGDFKQKMGVMDFNLGIGATF
jgi:predicted porin